MERKWYEIFRRAGRAAVGITLFIFFIISFCFPSWALDPDKPAAHYLVDQWELSAGLPSQSVITVTQTPDGYLWVATTKGLVRFDGLTFSTVRPKEIDAADPPADTIPDALLVDREGTLWIGSSSGLTAYDCTTGQFETYTAADGLTKDRIRYIKEDMKGNLWISFFASYVNRFADGRFTAFDDSHGLGGKKINGIVEDHAGNLLFGARENGVFQYRDGAFTKSPLPRLRKHQIITMYVHRDGALYIGANNGLFRVTDGETEHFTTTDGLADNYVTAITEDSGRNLWVATVKGLSRVKQDPDRTLRFETILKGLTITCLFEDRERSLWAGTLNDGLKRLKDSKFSSYPPLDAYPDEIFLSLFQDRDGVVWSGTFSGRLFKCREGEPVQEVVLPGVSGAGISAVTADADGGLWLGTSGKGVFQLKTGRAVTPFTTAEGLADNLVTSIFKDSRDRLWFATFDGVSRWDNGVIASLKTAGGLPGKQVHNVYEDGSHNILLATDKGIIILADGQLTKESMTHLLPGISVPCIHIEPPGPEAEAEGPVYWAATHGAGLKRIKNGRTVSFTTAEGLTTQFLYQFFEDPRGHFWLMSDSGVLRIAKRELNRPAAAGDEMADIVNCIAFGPSDGIKSIEFSNEFSRHSALRTHAGEFYFITRKGVTVVNPRNVGINKTPPPVTIETVLFDEQSVPFRRENLIYHGVHDFLFHFTAPTFLSPRKVRFKYRLEGADPDWVSLPPGNDRTAHYRGLKPGAYTFRVTAANSEGVWHPTGDSMQFTVVVYFHETLFFKILLLLLTAAIITAGVWLFIKKPWVKHEKYKGANIDPRFAEECIKKLRRLMETENIYRDADISLKALADKLSIHSHVLSQLLNEKLDRNFSEFINSYRIEEAKEILAGPSGAQIKISSLAFDVGFNTHVAFYNAFKKYTQMTPAQYRKECGKKK